MIYFVTILQSTQDRDRILHGGFFYHNRLETTFQSGIFFNILSVFIQCGGTDTVQFTTGQHGLQHIARIQCAVGLAGTDNGMQFIDEQNDLSVTVLHIIQYGLQTFLEFTSVFGTGYQCAHIKCEDLLILQSLRDIALDDTLCQTLHHGGLTDTGFTDQHGVILCLTGQDTYHITDLAVTSDDGIQLLVPCFLHQILPVFFQCIIGCFRVVTGDSLVASYGRQCLQETFSGDAVFLPDLGDLLVGILDHGKEQMLYGDIFVTHLFCFVRCADQYLVQILTDIRLTALHLYSLLQSLFCTVYKMILLDLHLFHKL